MRLKALLNGAPVPNWVKLLVLGGFLGFQAATVYLGQKEAVKELRIALRAAAINDSLRTAQVEEQLIDLNEKVERRTNMINFELKSIGTKIGYIVRQVE